MAFKVVFPAIYERVSPERTEEEISSALDRRFDSPAKAPRTEASTALAPPPPDSPGVPVKASIGKIERKRKGTGRPPSKPLVPCPRHDWRIIGKSRTEGMVRCRCHDCHRERTVPESLAPARIYRKG